VFPVSYAGTFCNFVCRSRKSISYTKGRGNEKDYLFCVNRCFGAVRQWFCAFGQATASGTIQGTVLDKSQAAVSGAQVEATNKATGSVRSTVTTEWRIFPVRPPAGRQLRS